MDRLFSAFMLPSGKKNGGDRFSSTSFKENFNKPGTIYGHQGIECG
jgi:hypothetical protein